MGKVACEFGVFADTEIYIYGSYLCVHERKCKYTYTELSSANLKGN